MAKGLGRGKMGRENLAASQLTEPEPAPWKVHRDGGRRDDNYIELTGIDRVYQGQWYDGHLLTDFVLPQQLRESLIGLRLFWLTVVMELSTSIIGIRVGLKQLRC